MRVLPFTILAAIALALQVSLAPAMRLTAARFQPQFLLIVALYVALYARAEVALIGCWVLGLLLDLSSITPMGGFAFAFGLVGLGIVSARASLFRDHPVSHFFLALVFGLLANEVVALREAVRFGLRVELLVIQPLGTAVYTALLAPYVMLLLNRFRRRMHFPDTV